MSAMSLDSCRCSTCVLHERDEREDNPVKRPSARGLRQEDLEEEAIGRDFIEEPLPYSEERAVACRGKNQGSGFIRDSLRHAIYLRDDYTCAYCGFQDPYRIGGTWYEPREGGKEIAGLGPAVRIGVTVDHVLACALGGSNKASNLVTVCGGCNSAKKHLTTTEWYLYLSKRHGFDAARLGEIRKVVRNRLRRNLDRQAGQLLGEEAAKARRLAAETALGGKPKAAARKWGFGREFDLPPKMREEIVQRSKR